MSQRDKQKPVSRLFQEIRQETHGLNHSGSNGNGKVVNLEIYFNSRVKRIC